MGSKKFLGVLVCLFLFLGAAPPPFPPPLDPNDEPKKRENPYFEFVEFEKVSMGLSAKETQFLNRQFEEFGVIDLEASNLIEISNFLDEVRSRLSHAIEKEGFLFSDYRIYLMTESEPTAYIYKHRPNGMNFYRGHVFLSTGLVNKLIETLDTPIAELSKQQLDEILYGITGILAHEFTHPKEDEMIRWSLSEDQDRKSGSQANELATDLLSLKVARSAKFPIVGLLKGLELLFGIDPNRRGHYTSRTLGALFSTHPERNLRLLMVAGALTHARLEYGDGEVVDLATDRNLFRKELEQLIAGHDVALGNARSGVSVVSPIEDGQVIKILREIREIARKELNDDAASLKKVRNRFAAIKNELEARGAPPTNAEVEEYLDTLDFMVTNRTSLTAGTNDTWDGSGHRFNGNVALGRTLCKTSPIAVRRRQKIFSEIPIYSHPRFLEIIKDRMTRNIWRVFPFNSSDHFRAQGEYELLPGVFDKKTTLLVYREVLKHVDSRTPIQQMRYLLSVLYGNIVIQGPVDLDLEILTKVLALAKSGEEARNALLETFSNIFEIEREFLNQRFLQWREAHPDQSGKLLKVYDQIIQFLFEAPHNQSTTTFYQRFFNSSIYRSSSTGYRALELLLWSRDPSQFLLRFHRKTHGLNVKLVEKIVTDLLMQDTWQDKIGERAEDSMSIGQVSNESIVASIADFLKYRDTPLSLEQRFRISQILRKRQGAKEVPIKSEVDLVHTFKGELRQKVAVELVKDLGGFDNFVTKVVEFYGPEVDFIKTVFKDDSNDFFSTMKALVRAGLLTDAGMFQAVQRFAFPEKVKVIQFSPFVFDRESSFDVWKLFDRHGVSGVDFLKRVVGVFDVEIYQNAPLETEHYHLQSEIRNAVRAKVKILPHYVKLLTHLRDPLTRDLRRLVGVTRDVEVESKEYRTKFREKFEQVLEFYKLIFNADGVLIPNHYRKLAKYIALDDLSDRFLSIVPEGLSQEQYKRIWFEVAAKRANRFTDAFFRKRVRSNLEKLPSKERKKVYDKILSHGMVFSQQLRVSMLREVMEEELARLKSIEGSVVDADFYQFISRIQYLVPDRSRFLNKYLDEVAWDVNLNEPQLRKFIEPLKTMNYRAVDTYTLNLLSAMNIVLEKLNTKERLALVKYIREPKGYVLDVVPRLDNLITKAENEHYEFRKMDLRQRFESFVREAGESERLVLIQMLVGSRGIGLWDQGPEIREQLFEMVEMTPGTATRDLFGTYLKAVGSYEHSIIMSYLLSMESGEGAFELVKLLELFRAPGVKFGQMAQILGVFDPKYDEELKELKDRASVPSKADVYEMLKEIYPAPLYDKILSVERLLGSGSIKVVALVEFKDGTTQAVYIKRPYSVETIDSTLRIASIWMKHLQALPDYNDAYDYDYYLETLHKQLETEVDFELELKNSKEMQKYYRGRSLGGWKFEGVPPSENILQNGEVLHFTPIRGAVRFSKLSLEDKKTVGKLIVGTELDLLFKKGVFDADRHIGNYLFDPKTKTIYPIDFGQVYRFKKDWFWRPDDRWAVSKVLEGLGRSDFRKAAKSIFAGFYALRIEEVNLNEKQKQEIVQGIQDVLSAGDLPFQKKLLRVLGEINKGGVRLPMRISLGLVKAMVIVMNEEYAKHVDPDFSKGKLKWFVFKQKIRGVFVSMFSSCDRILTDK